jgi:hypothetical protein
MPSVHDAGAHAPAVQILLEQSPGRLQTDPSAHPGQTPPQSTPVSVPFSTPSLHPGALHTDFVHTAL